MILQKLRARVRDGRSEEGGYVAVMTAVLLVVLIGLSAFAVDVGRWYLVGQQEQRAADAAALAGVTALPADLAGAITTSGKYAKVNGFAHDPGATLTPDPTTVFSRLDSSPTRLRVTINRTVHNVFGSLLGVPTTTIGRTAVADYAGPVPMGSPCNEFGDDPYPAGNRSTNCSYAGQFWANVGSPKAAKGKGDAYQNDMATNTDFDPNGYFYAITVRQPVANLRIEAFDPALIDVGDYCGVQISAGPPATYKPDPGKLLLAKTLTYPAQTVVSDPASRYANGATPFCTGDNRFGGTGQVATQFTVRSPGPRPWDPLSFPEVGGTCTQTFAGYTGDLSKALDKTNAAYTSRPDVAANFRQWKTLCTIPNAVPGTYLVQVKTNAVGNDLADGHNRFSLRAYGGSSALNDSMSIAGYFKMAMYGNTPSGTTTFYLAKVPSSAKGQLFNVRLWDIGDGATSGSTVTVLPPVETGGAFSGCTGAGVQTGTLTNCRISVSSSFDSKWQTIAVPIPATYSCSDLSVTGCWVRLEFFYGPLSNPADTTSWTASIQGDPVRLVE